MLNLLKRKPKTMRGNDDTSISVHIPGKPIPPNPEVQRLAREALADNAKFLKRMRHLY